VHKPSVTGSAADAGRVAIVEFSHGPGNYLSGSLLGEIADRLDALAADGRTRAVVLCSSGRHFCAGAALAASDEMKDPVRGAADIYAAGARLIEQPLPVVVAVQGAAVGGGLGLALAFDYRVATPATRFAANFARIGLHQGFGLTVTLPDVVGPRVARDLLYSGRSVRGDEAHLIGLCDRLVSEDELRAEAVRLAGSLAHGAPLAVRAIRATMRQALIGGFRRVTAHELAEQSALFGTADFTEGVRATAERREPRFAGR
jgi:2-(1,2-epoxy-1,2-dihydrophenyl)acetyl-CoA isomerase